MEYSDSSTRAKADLATLRGSESCRQSQLGASYTHMTEAFPTEPKNAHRQSTNTTAINCTKLDYYQQHRKPPDANHNYITTKTTPSSKPHHQAAVATIIATTARPSLTCSAPAPLQPSCMQWHTRLAVRPSLVR